MLKLYHTPLSAACRKIRIILREKGLEAELVQENPWERRVEFFALNPAGEVPVLVHDKAVLCHSSAIGEFLEEVYTEHNLLGRTPLEKAETRRIAAWFDDKFYDEVTHNLVFEKVYKRLWGYGEPASDAIRAGNRNIGYHLDYIAYLLKDRLWLAGERFSLADITAAAHLSCIDYLGSVPWESNARAKEWYALVKSRPSFRAILKDRVMGIRPPEHYENPDF